jgi:hypothetical protein
MALTMLDSAGAAMSVGDTVKLVGVVAALNPADNRFNEVTVTLTNPNYSVGDSRVAPGAELLGPGPVKTIIVQSTMLTKGA